MTTIFTLESYEDLVFPPFSQTHMIKSVYMDYDNCTDIVSRDFETESDTIITRTHGVYFIAETYFSDLYEDEYVRYTSTWKQIEEKDVIESMMSAMNEENNSEDTPVFKTPNILERVDELMEMGISEENAYDIVDSEFGLREE